MSEPDYIPRKAATPEPGLYIVATPIGNLGDITIRALDILRGVDVIACEDTRTTRKLLSHYDIPTPTTPYHDHNAAKARPALIKMLQDGKSVALVSDAGTPLISDPGFKLVRALADEDITVYPIPGASAALAALVVSGLPTDRFLFVGFLPPKSAARRKALAELAGIPASLVIYESGRRLAAALKDMAAVLGTRDAALGRELTKKFEEVRRGTLESLASELAAEPPPKGEIVIVIGPAADAPAPDDEALSTLIASALKTASLRDAVDQVTIKTGLARRTVYKRALEIADRPPTDKPSTAKPPGP